MEDADLPGELSALRVQRAVHRALADHFPGAAADDARSARRARVWRAACEAERAAVKISATQVGRAAAPRRSASSPSRAATRMWPRISKHGSHHCAQFLRRRLRRCARRSATPQPPSRTSTSSPISTRQRRRRREGGDAVAGGRRVARVVRREHDRRRGAVSARAVGGAPARVTAPSQCLEDMAGGVARDRAGRPIIAVIGSPHGTADEQRASSSTPSSARTRTACPKCRRRRRRWCSTSCPPRRARRPPSASPTATCAPPSTCRAGCGRGGAALDDALLRAAALRRGDVRLVKPFMARAKRTRRWCSSRRSPTCPATSTPRACCAAGAAPSTSTSTRTSSGAPPRRARDRRRVRARRRRAYDKRAAEAASVQAARESASGGGGTITAKALCGADADAAAQARRRVEARLGNGLFSTLRWKAKLLCVAELGVVYFDGAAPPTTTGRRA